jgi:hypothetical protein
MREHLGTLIASQEIVSVAPDTGDGGKSRQQLAINGKAVKRSVVPLHDLKRRQPQLGPICHLK